MNLFKERGYMKKLYDIFYGFIKYKALIYELVIRDIKVRYKRSVLGLLWTILNPILMMTVMTIVFSRLFRFEIENFTIYFFTANLLFSFMTESTTNALYSVISNSTLIKKVYIPKYLFPVSKIMSGMVNLFFSFIALILVMIVTRAPFHVTMWLSPIIIIYVMIFATGLGLLLSVIMVFFRDISQLYSVITLVWMYLTPVFYPVSLLEQNAKWALIVNPMYHYIAFFRKLVVYGTMPSLEENLLCLTISIVTLMIGVILFYKKQDKFILYI